MSLINVNSYRGNIATQLRQVSFDPLDIEYDMYSSDQGMVSMYAYDIKASTWSQIEWKDVCGSSDGNCYTFALSGREFGILKPFDYLLAIALEAVFPQVTLANTPAPVNYSITYPGSTDTPLCYYLSDGNLGLAAGTLYIGSYGALHSLTGSSMSAGIQQFVSYQPRQIVSWSQYALLAAIDEIKFKVNGIDFTRFDKNALFAALQFRMRQDVFPIAGEDATSFRAVQAIAGVEGAATKNTVLGDTEDNRYKAFTIPFSFTTSALTDRGQNGKHLSAFPLLLCCNSSVCIEVKTIQDLRKLLVLQQEVLTNNSSTPVVIVSPSPVSLPVTISNASTVYTIPSSAFSTSFGSTGLYLSNGSSITLSTTPVTTLTTIGSSSNNSSKTTYSSLTLSNFGVSYLSQTGVYLPVCRYGNNNNSCSEFDYSTWITNDCDDLKLQLRSKVLGSVITDLERGMSKVDCRNRRYLYEDYVYSCEKQVCPGREVCIRIERTPGQFKYAYTFAENETSLQQGQYFNFTNSTEFVVTPDVSLLGAKFIFIGDSSIQYFNTKIQGYEDVRGRAKFFKYVDNALFAQRCPHVNGLYIIPRYANFINSIYPDGSINMDNVCDLKVDICTQSSACYSSNGSCFPIPPQPQGSGCSYRSACGCTSGVNTSEPNTYMYKVYVVSVITRIAEFELCE